VESVAVIVAESALLGMELATVKVVFWLALVDIGLKLPADEGETVQVTAWFAEIAC
jgi:hypothetical protein